MKVIQWEDLKPLIGDFLVKVSRIMLGIQAIALVIIVPIYIVILIWFIFKAIF